MIHALLQEITEDPQEYRPFLILLGVVLGVWFCLCVCAVVAACQCVAKRKVRFFLTLVALLPSLLGVCAQIPVSVESNGTRWSGDLRWLFVLPGLLGVYALARWWQDGKPQVPQDLATVPESNP